ncbi:glyoxylase I 7 [Hibiscus trionum]|uniref:Glyoxylase I 7 n=1 Tax=Hibiscus trionum TaxID=183268 RepID=A0A9W7M041_HIBTR|nr:glyoxylase I 7 [Hibiscus trionum]
MENPLQLKCLNHVSLLCRSVEKSVDFYQNILGFSPIKRPGSLDFSGAWLFNYDISIHLLRSENPESMPKIGRINPKDNHMSFQCQCDSMATLENKLKELNIEYMKGGVEEGGIRVDQLFFHDPDGNMIELCNCDNLPVIPLPVDTIQSCSMSNCNVRRQRQQQQELQERKIEHTVEI